MNKNQSRIITSSALATILEWYDFALFAYLTPILAKLFFPNENLLTGLLLSYAIFAVGFFVRPLGAMLFGHLGDRIGRKKTLILTVILMSLPTFCMGLLPTYHSIGLAAPIILILLRICQGLSVGGESTGAILFVLETTPIKKRGFMGALLWSMTGFGMLLGSFAATLVTHYPEFEWAWRVPFLLGIFTGMIVFFLRKKASDLDSFQQIIQEHKRYAFPLREGILKYHHEMGAIIGLYILSAMITYLIFIFMPSYASNVLGFSSSKTSLIGTGSFLASTLLVPLGGLVADRIGKQRCLYWSAIGFVFLSYPLFYFMGLGLIYLMISQGIFIVLSVFFQGALTATVVEILPANVRYSVIAVGYNLSYAIFGGTAPFIATYLVSLTGNKAAPGAYLMFGALIAMFISLRNFKLGRSYS